MAKKLQNSNFIEQSGSQEIFNNIFISYKRKRSNTFKIKRKDYSFEDKMKIVIECQGGKIAIDEICEREGISSVEFQQWTQEFLNINKLENDSEDLSVQNKSDIEKYKLVIEGKTGETSIAEICRREKITHDTFMKWSELFLNLRRKNLEQFKIDSDPIFQMNKESICRNTDIEVFNYLENYIDLSSKESIVFLKSNSLRLDYIEDVENIICLERINDVRYINKFFEKINVKLQTGGIFIGRLETLSGRRKRLKINKIPVLNSVYFGIEFLFKRILPKVSFTKKHYFDITKGTDRLLSKAEGLGRLVSCGFKIMDFKSINGMLYFVVKKIKEPEFDFNPSYGPIYKMPRLGKNGKIFGVYKFRTMHPYSEYLQDYVINAYGYGISGKPANDFRIPIWGKFMRRFWLDEIPQLLNVLKGELKLVGIRPVSQRYFEDIPKEMQKLRLTEKPGCIPPYVALNRDGSVMSVLQSEKEYLEEKINNPFSTDVKYFFNAIFNIIFKHKRSA